jgi:hypothetical protein
VFFLFKHTRGSRTLRAHYRSAQCQIRCRIIRRQLQASSGFQFAVRDAIARRLGSSLQPVVARLVVLRL